MARRLTDTDHATLLNDAINGFFESSIEQAAHIDPSYRHLWETLYGLIRAGGKKLRPKMTVMAYEAFGGKDVEKIIPVAAAQELLHFCLLIHDDVIDRDYVRYGVANVAGRYKIAYSKYVISTDDQTHYAHGAAILGGDLMLSGAHQLIASCRLTDEEKMLAQRYLAQSTFEVAGGELLDTELSFAPYNDGDALKVARYKTASYSFVTPLMTGASLAKINDRQKTALRSYAVALGTAYQLVDDLLGIFGDEEQTGKSSSSDILEGKRTYMIERTLQSLSDSDKAMFSNAFGNPQATAMEIQTVKQLIEATGAKTAAEEKVRDYTLEAEKALGKLRMSQPHHDAFKALIDNVTRRQY